MECSNIPRFKDNTNRKSNGQTTCSRVVDVEHVRTSSWVGSLPPSHMYNDNTVVHMSPEK